MRNREYWADGYPVKNNDLILTHLDGVEVLSTGVNDQKPTSKRKYRRTLKKIYRMYKVAGSDRRRHKLEYKIKHWYYRRFK